jgi:hypothetical protein
MAQTQSKNSASVTTSSGQIAGPVIGDVRRVQIVITNISPTTVTIAFGDDAAVANQGILLSQNQTYIESDDVAFRTWQGAIQAIGSAASTLSVSERFE